MYFSTLYSTINTPAIFILLYQYVRFHMCSVQLIVLYLANNNVKSACYSIFITSFTLLFFSSLKLEAFFAIEFVQTFFFCSGIVYFLAKLYLVERCCPYAALVGHCLHSYIFFQQSSLSWLYNFSYQIGMIMSLMISARFWPLFLISPNV